MNGKFQAMQRAAFAKMGRAEIEQPTMTGDTLSDLMFAWTQQTSKDLQQSLLSNRPKGKNTRPGFASGSLWQSLGPEGTQIIERGNEVIARITAQEEWQWVDGGRKPTRNSGDGSIIKSLTEWIASKGIQVRQSAQESSQTVQERNLSLAHAIAKKIHAKGFYGNNSEGTGFFSRVINDQAFDDLAEYLGESTGEKIRLSFELVAKENKAQPGFF
jgi:hypothetical protein